MTVEMNSITTQKPVANNGNSLSVSLTKEFRALGIKAGDWISVTISKIEPASESNESEDEDKDENYDIE